MKKTTRVDRDRDVVLRDRLRRESKTCSLSEIHAHMVDEGNFNVEAVVPGGEIRSQTLDNSGFSLRNDLHTGDGQDHHDDDEHDEEGEQWHSVPFDSGRFLRFRFTRFDDELDRLLGNDLDAHAHRKDLPRNRPR